MSIIYMQQILPQKPYSVKTSLLLSLINHNIIHLIYRSNLRIPASCRTVFPLTSPYWSVFSTAVASFSQDFERSLFNHQDITSHMQRRGSSRRFAPMVNKAGRFNRNCWPSWNQWASANSALWRTFRIFLSSSCITAIRENILQSLSKVGMMWTNNISHT